MTPLSSLDATVATNYTDYQKFDTKTYLVQDIATGQFVGHSPFSSFGWEPSFTSNRVRAWDTREEAEKWLRSQGCGMHLPKTFLISSLTAIPETPVVEVCGKFIEIPDNGGYILYDKSGFIQAAGELVPKDINFGQQYRVRGVMRERDSGGVYFSVNARVQMTEGSSPEMCTVSGLNDLPEGTTVELEGKFVHVPLCDDYIFSDGTGFIFTPDLSFAVMLDRWYRVEGMRGRTAEGPCFHIARLRDPKRTQDESSAGNQRLTLDAHPVRVVQVLHYHQRRLLTPKEAVAKDEKLLWCLATPGHQKYVRFDDAEDGTRIMQVTKDFAGATFFSEPLFEVDYSKGLSEVQESVFVWQRVGEKETGSSLVYLDSPKLIPPRGICHDDD